MSRKILNRILVAKDVAVADKYVYDLENGAMKPNDLVFFNPVTGKSLGAGVTYATNPKIEIGQAVDLDGDGMVDGLRHFTLDGSLIFNVTTDIPRAPINQIKNVYWKCVSKDTDYGLNVHWRNNDTLLNHTDNQWAFKTLTANVGDYECSSCDTAVDCKEISCAMHRQFYGLGLTSKDSLFLRRSLATQAKEDGVEVMPILGKEVQYCVAAFAGACGGCTEIDAISGVRIIADPALVDHLGNPFIPADVTVNFAGTLVSGSTTRSYYGQLTKIMNLVNKAFKDNGITGHAVAIEGITGTARVCDPVKILINSCYTIQLLDGTGTPITPCVPEYNPFTGKSFVNQATCVGCSPGSAFTPNCGLRVIGKPIKIDKNCIMPDKRVMWYFTEVDITQTPESSFSTFHVETMQDIQVPDGMGVQYYWKMLDQHVEGTGFDYSPGLTDVRGVYSDNKADRLSKNAAGLDITQSYASISFEFGMGWQTQFVNAPTDVAMMSAQLLVGNTDVATKAKIIAILNPWLASIPNPRPALDITTDVDQTNTLVDATGTVTQEAVSDLGE